MMTKIKKLGDLKSALKQSTANSFADNQINMDDFALQKVAAEDLGPSNYERFVKANEHLRLAKNAPSRYLDFPKIKRLEDRVSEYGQLVKDEVARFKGKFPSLTHAELSRKALENHVAEQDEFLRQEALRSSQEMEAKAKADLAQKQRDEEQAKLAAEAKVREEEAYKKLVDQAKSLKKELSLVVCKYCKDGKEEVDCDTCNGTGRVAPYEVEVVKTKTGCCNRPTCTVCAGTGIYTMKSKKFTTVCSNTACNKGTVLAPCSVCYGSRILNKQGECLSLSLLKNVPLVQKIQNLLGIPSAWSGTK